jgi:hypothetical protein
MKSIFYIVGYDKIVFTIRDGVKTKTINIIRDDSNILNLDYSHLDWDGTVVSAIRSLLFKLNIKYDVCMIETINASPDVVWDWTQKNLVHINSRYSFMWTMEGDESTYHDWEMLNKVFEKLGYTIEGWEYEVLVCLGS